MIFLLALPAALALVVLATPLMATIFFHGEITPYDIGKMTLSLQAYGIGLFAFMLIKVLAPGYYARQDTKTPVKIGIQAMVVNMVLNLALVGPFQHAGLALATSLSAFFNAYMLYRGLKATGHYKAQPGWLAFAFKVLVANAALFVVMYFMMGDAQQWLEWGTWQRIGWMSAIVGAGVAVYFVTLVVFGLRPRHLKGARF
jgi:putative peptidoglycan lipid II flippase